MSDVDRHAAHPSDNGGIKRLFKFALGLIVFFGILLVVGILPRLSQNKEQNSAAREQATAIPVVSTVTVQQPPPFDTISLPGNVEAMDQTAVIARQSGYVKQWFVDIGDHVKAGQTLATIATPDFDQQVIQARAQVSQALSGLAQARGSLANLRATLLQADANLLHAQAQYEQAKTQLAQSKAAEAQAEDQSAQQHQQLVLGQANLDLARVTAQRYNQLLASGAIDRQTTDQNNANYRTNQANVSALQSAERASQANVNAAKAAVDSSAANVAAFADDIGASRAQITAAQANVDSGVAGVESAQQNVEAGQANLQRMVVLQAYNKVTAPFSGIVTARNIDVGTLISSGGTVASSASDSTTVGNSSVGATANGNAAGGTSATSGAEAGSSSSGSSATTVGLFSIAQDGALRVYVNVPQADAAEVRPGLKAQIAVSELAGQQFTGTVTRTSGSLDATTRTLVTEIRMDKGKAGLKPGMFAQVSLRVPHSGETLLIPDAALVTNANGTQAVVVTPDNKVHYQPIVVGRDFGKVIEAVSGLQTGQQVINSPSDTLREGQTVKPQPVPTQ